MQIRVTAGYMKQCMFNMNKVAMQSILYIEITYSKWKVPLPLCCVKIISGIPAGEASPFKTLVTRGGAIGIKGPLSFSLTSSNS